MNAKAELSPNPRSIAGDIISCIVGIAFIAAGLVNMFWGNDSLFGVFIVLASFAFFPPVSDLFKKITGFKIRVWMKIVLALFMAWALIGVGELFDKIDMMRNSMQ